MMTNTQKLLTKISQKTIEIKTNYPELQKYLDETRITLPQGDTESSEIDNEELSNYLNSLDTMVEKYKSNT
ncbi:hypothetical protein [Psychroserpens sp. NJDZ02]|uniref:hypothetical protein n=1 Tax=Psychroserpens sp. NJDZ02 TaxID=2570561 RepID=UPI0010A7F4A0|nr:hypothetical protein [Psychroserpens sp. NJDZ02]QCE41182.1 hypothetical protein E9099_07055 [Psychroserpens sp. NJDZ02]